MKPELPEDLRARILSAASATPAPVRRESRRRAAALTLLGVVAAIAVFFAIGGVRPGARPLPFSAGVAALWALLAVMASFFALSRGGRMVGRSPRFSGVLALVSAPLLALSVGVFALVGGAALVGGIAGAMHIACAATASAFGVLPLGAWMFAHRGTVTHGEGARGAAFGAAAGVIGATLVHLHCPGFEVAHSVIGHATPALVLALVGYLLGRVVLPIRRLKG